MKIILFAPTIACLTSCNQVIDKINKAASTDSLKTNFENKNSELSQEILKEIKIYYQQKYGTEARIEEENTDTLSCINLTEGTVKGYVSAIFEKLGVTTAPRPR